MALVSTMVTTSEGKIGAALASRTFHLPVEECVSKETGIDVRNKRTAKASLSK